MTVWSTPSRCLFSPGSATRTSTGPRVLRRADFEPGTINADIGGGPFPEATRQLKRRRVRNVLFDPGHQTPAQARRAAARIRGGKARTATVANVLNVIPDAGCRRQVIRQAADAVGARGVAYFSVHEGDGTGRGRRTSRGWQANRGLRSYLPEVRRAFCEARVEGGVIVARGKKPCRRS